jgi:hypothetical protein
MSAALVVVWVGTSASLGAHQEDLEGWASAREQRIEVAAHERALPAAGHDDTLADRVESLLSQARADAFSASPSGASAALDTAEKLLEGAPSLPECAFLMAEVYRQRGLLVALSDPALGHELEARAVALGGARAAPFAGAGTDVHGPRSEALAPARVGAPSESVVGTAAAPAASPVRLEGPMPDDEIEIDGVEVHDAPTLPDGAHHVRVLRGGRLAWAGWIAAQSGAIRAPVPVVATCSETDVLPPAGSTGHAARCERYAIARPAGPERIEVALCHRSSCGEFLPWSRAWGASFELPVHSPRSARPSHSWILWTVVGVAATAVGALVLAEEGAFERRAPPRDTFTFEMPAPK